MTNEFYSLAEALGHRLQQHDDIMATAESCTGGWLAEVITQVPRASYWFDRGFITYSNQAKHECLGVDLHLIDSYGAVSKQTACAMVEGVLQHSRANMGVAITGIAGPSGGSKDKPVGTVWIAWCIAGETSCECFHFQGDRQTIRASAVKAALNGLLDRLL